MASKVEWALKHASRGWKVFPLQPNLKIPYAGFKWKEEATTDKAIIEKWWTYWPDANIAIATGEDSNLTVVDVDDVAEFELCYPLHQSNYVIKTPNGGYHYYFMYEHSAQTGVRRLPGADIRNDGGYVVACGSAGYENLCDDGISTMPEVMKMEVFTREAPSHNLPVGETDIGPGERNAFLAEAAGRLQRLDVLSSEALHALNLARCTPPLPRNEVDAIAASVARYLPAKPITIDTTPAEQLNVDAADLGTAMIEALSNKARMSGQPTCFPGLNKLLGGGLRKGEFVALHAPGKQGKSSVVHQLIQGLLTSGVPVGYASREMDPAEEVLPNLLSIEYSENAWKMDMTEERVGKYLERIKNWPLSFTTGYGPIREDVLQKWLEDRKKSGIDYFFLDHFHYCLELEEYTATAKLAQVLKKATKDLDICLVSIIQPKSLMPDQELAQNTLRGGSAIGQALDVLLTLQRYCDPQTRERLDDINVLQVADIRHKLGKKGKIYLQYDVETTRIQEVEISHEIPTQPEPEGPRRLESVL